MKTRRIANTLALAVIAGSLLGGCSDGGDDNDSDGLFSLDDVPECSAVLQVGAELPEGYEGCQDEHGDLGAVLVYDDGDCGRTVWVVGDDLWAYADDRIVTDEDIWSICYGYAEETPSGSPSTDPGPDTAPARITVDCPKDLEDGTYIRQDDGRYVWDKDTEYYPFTLAEVESMNENYGCEVVD